VRLTAVLIFSVFCYVDVEMVEVLMKEQKIIVTEDYIELNFFYIVMKVSFTLHPVTLRVRCMSFSWSACTAISHFMREVKKKL
jgi:hypothetical protein